MAQAAYQNHQGFAGDRFIAHRNPEVELSNNYETKAEIFSASTQQSQCDKLGNQTILSQGEDENQQQ